MSSQIGISVNDRIKLIFNNLKEKQQSFAKKVGVSQSFLSKVLRGECKAPTDMLNGILKTYPNINARWLITGEGSMYQQPQAESQSAENVQTPKLTKREKDMLMIFRELPEMEQDEILQLSRKEKEFVDIRARLEAIERKTG